MEIMNDCRVALCSIFLFCASLQCEGSQQPARIATAWSEVPRGRIAVNAERCCGTTEHIHNSRIAEASTGDPWNDSSSPLDAEDSSSVESLPWIDCDPGDSEAVVVQRIRDTTIAFALLCVTLLANIRPPYARRQRTAHGSRPEPQRTPGGYRRRLAMSSKSDTEKRKRQHPGESSSPAPVQPSQAVSSPSQQAAAPSHASVSQVSSSLSQLQLTSSGGAESSHSAPPRRSTALQSGQTRYAQSNPHNPIPLLPSLSSTPPAEAPSPELGARPRRVACPIGWTCAGLSGAMAAKSMERSLPSASTILGKSINDRVDALVTQESKRQAVALLQHSSKTRRTDEPSPRKSLDEMLIKWQPSDSELKDAKEETVRKFGNRTFAAAVAATMLVSPTMQAYLEWLTETEARGTQELTLILEQKRREEAMGHADKEGRVTLQERLRRLSRESPCWGNGPSRDLLLWLGKTRLQEVVNPTKMKKKSRLRLSRKELFSLPSMGAVVLPAIQEEGEPEEAGEPAGASGAAVSPAVSEMPPQIEGHSSGSSAVGGLLDAIQKAFTCKEKIVLRKELRGFNTLVEEMKSKLRDVHPDTAAAALREHALVKLGEVMFARKLRERARRWKYSKSRLPTRMKRGEGLESLQTVPAGFWTDPYT
ncbi:hypothetical protein TGPRC2_288840 [Toxoplasma gondii TgCatPRC2]|uniref:Transmembrane protein n=1 Tax=Toxoplasma gondii TgCatPRC2 TaxID=1130821 RepID=A0A151HJG1_TOXGO|nr:hypothetical protein TGPRC2_288840 [Toxoplasma gondii TgCatPRC2]